MKRYSNYILIFAIILPVFLAGRGMASGQTRNIEAKVLNDIVLCNSSDRAFNFKIDIGKVAVADSFVGYDLWMKYDPKKVRITKMLPGNSYTEICLGQNPNYAGMIIGVDKNNELDGTFRAYGMLPVKYIMYGERHLVAFSAVYVGPDSCGETSPIEFEYIDFLDNKSFKNQELIYKNSEVKVTTGDVSKNIMDIKCISEKKLDDATEYIVNYAYSLKNTKKLSKIDFEVENKRNDVCDISIVAEPNSLYEINTAETVEENNIQKIKISGTLTALTDTNLFKVKVTFKNTTTDSTDIKISAFVKDNCNCISDINAKTAKLINTRPVQAIENNSDDIIVSNGKLFFKNRVSSAVIYNLFGQIVFEQNENYNELLNLNNLSNGIYFVKIKINDNKFEIKKIIINN